MYPTWHTSVKLWEFWAWAVRWLWALSFLEHAAWSRMAQVLLLCLSSHSLVVSCPAWGWSQAAVLPHRQVHDELQQQQVWLLQQAKSTCIYQLEWLRLRFGVVWKCCVYGKVGLNVYPQYFHSAVKGGFYDDIAGCLASIYCLHEHSPLHSHISPGEEQLLWEVFFVLFLTGGYRLPQKIFKYILLEIVNTPVKWAVTAWECSHCSIGVSAATELQEHDGALDTQSKWFLSCWQKTQQASKSA